MQTSNELNELAPALAKAQGEIGTATKSSDNPFFKSKYADLSEVINVTKPAFTANGLSWVTTPITNQNDATGETMVGINTILLHASGQYIMDTMSMPISSSKNPAQEIGKVVTYFRRYALAAIANLSQEDDDGQSLTQKKPVKHKPAPPVSDASLKAYHKEVEELLAATESDVPAFLAWQSVTSISDLKLDTYAVVIDALQKKGAK